jgi:predicted phosphoribosyltransferase
MFRDRAEAGKLLAASLSQYADRDDVVVLALPRGGVPVAFEVATRLHAPLDVFVVRKLGVPGHEELAMGAIASGDVLVLNEDVVSDLQITREQIAPIAATEQIELERRERTYRGNAPRQSLRGKTVLLVDDGLATGSSMLAALRALRFYGPERIVVAVPVAASDTCEWLRGEADDVICARTPEPFHAVGTWYHDFSETTDEEVRDLLTRAARPPGKAPGGDRSAA